METLSPECSASVFPVVIVFRELSFQLLHEAAEIAELITHDKQVDMVAGYAECEY
jgi:hypothetical protein